MKDTLWLIRKILISTFKNYRNLLLYFGLPVIGILLASLIHGGSGAVELNMGIVNRDSNQVITRDAIDFIKHLDSVHISEIQESEVTDLIAAGKLDAVLKFPAGFAQSLKSGSPESVQIVSIKGAQVTGYVKSYLNQYIDTMTSIGKVAAGNEAKFDALYADYQKAGFHLSSETVKDQSVNHKKSNQTIGYLIILMLFAAANLSGIIIKERENRTYYRMISSPIAARTYVMSNIAVNLGIMIMQIAVTLVVMNKIFNVDPGIPYWILFLILVIFALVAISLSLAIVAFSKSSLAANSFQSAVFLPTCLLAGCLFPLDLMPAMMQKIAYFLPQYWLLDTIGKLQLGNPLWSLYVNLMILIAFAMAFSLVAIYKFGRNNDSRSYI